MFEQKNRVKKRNSLWIWKKKAGRRGDAGRWSMELQKWFQVTSSGRNVAFFTIGWTGGHNGGSVLDDETVWKGFGLHH